MKTAITLTLVILGSQLFINRAIAAPSNVTRPKLIVMLVIDQFRADYLTRFQKNFRPVKGKNGEVGGFQYLMSSGAYYPYGQYDILQSMTGPGHATVLTGAYPYQAGIPTNNWYDPDKNSQVYCTEDPSAKTVGAENSNPHVGTSPKLLVATTVGDELKNAGYPSRVVSIAVKDRAAILMGGHRADLALWLDPKAYKWVSSSFYFPDGKLPDWVGPLNQELEKQKGKTWTWNPEGPETGYSQTETYSVKSQWDSSKIGKEFPHPILIGSQESITSPFGLELTATAADRAIDAYKLGQGRATDLLAVSFSSHDYVGHAFGPNSREAEQMTLVEDRLISKLLNHLRKSVPGGLNNVVVVLTGDHGVAPVPEYLQQNRIEASRIVVDDVLKQMESHLNEKFGKPKGDQKWVPLSIDLSFYINHKAVSDRGAQMVDVENEVKEILRKVPGIAHTFSASDVGMRRLPPGQFERQILKTFYPNRSADVIAIPKPFVISAGATADHMTGYAYDRTVPIILSGFHIKSGQRSQRAEVVDIAPTLTYLAGSIPPSLSEGRVLSEALAE